MAISSAHIPVSWPVATALLSSERTECCTGVPSGPLVAKWRRRHCYQPPLTTPSSFLQGPFVADLRLLRSVARERRFLETSLFPPTRIGVQALACNPRKKVSWLAPLRGTLESELCKNWGRKEEEEDVSGTERPTMAGRLAATGPPSTSAPSRLSASQQGFNHRGLGLRCYNSFAQAEPTVAHVTFPGWGAKCERAPRSCQASAARKTATFESPAEVDFRALQEIAGIPDVGNGASRRGRSRRTVGNAEEGVASEAATKMREGVKRASFGASVDDSANGGDVHGVDGGGVNGVDVNGAPKRRRRTAAAGDGSTAKKSAVRRRRTSKVGEDAKPGNQTEDANGESEASDSDSDVLSAAGSANRATVNGAKVDRSSTNSPDANGTVADKPVNGRRRAVRRRKAGDADSEAESEAVASEARDSESEREAEGLESGVNGRVKPVRRRRRAAKEAVTSDAESDGPRSSGEESDSFSDGFLDASSPNGHGKVEMLTYSSAQERTFNEIGEELDPPEESVGYRLPPSQASKPLLPPAKPSQKVPEPRARAPRSAAGFMKEKLRQGLAVVSGNAGTDGEIDNSIDPHRLVRGELVVHKRVGIGRFRELRTEKVEGRAQPVLFVYLEYADGLAKLPAHQAHRLLYRYRRWVNLTLLV